MAMSAIPGVSSQGSTPVADCWNWSNRVAAETKTAKNWERDWGFLVQLKRDDVMDGAAKRKSEIDPEQAKNFYRCFKAPEQVAPRNATRGPNDSLDEFIELSLKRAGYNKRTPQEETKRPLITSQQIGWGRSLERFGKMTLQLR